jgi:2-(1,2-epoxy-1,2-dihydrophenyl)acetyl-CoA isomerase
VVAAINGVAAGAGLSLALACDFRIASEKARLVPAFIQVGLVPDSGAIWLLTRLVGSAKAFELCALGEPIAAEDALRMGLVTQVVPADELEPGWQAFARRLADGPTRAIALTKSLGNFAADASLRDQLDEEVKAQTEAGRTEDHLEGVNAFFERRAAAFKGR